MIQHTMVGYTTAVSAIMMIPLVIVICRLLAVMEIIGHHHRL